jgi:hypothetical protein
MLIFAILALFVVASEGQPHDPRSEDLTAILEKARRVQVADVEAWRRYRFRRHWLREERDEAGRVENTESMVFEVTPRGGSFHEQLVEIDGRTPTQEERRQFQNQARFAKHYRTLVAGSGEKEEGGYSLGHLLRMSSYRYKGRETVEGVVCYRIDFAPDPTRELGGVEGKLARAMEGSIWITVEGLHLARASAHTVRPVSLALSLAKVHELDLVMESGPVGEGIWLPTDVDLKTSVRILFSTRRRRNVYHYAEFHREPAPTETPPPGR